MRSRIPARQVRFEVIDDHLVRTVTGRDGRAYVQRCTRRVFEAVAYAVAEIPAEGEGATSETLARGNGLPFTQVNVALEFLKERGCVVTRWRRTHPASTFVFEDAMVEYHALAEGG